MTYEEALALIPEGWERCRADQKVARIDCASCYVYMRPIQPLEPKTMTFKAFPQWNEYVTSNMMVLPEGVDIPCAAECEVTITWTPKPGVKS
jgi:hypothetical protein